jgi:deazaflavin-dependent oxidoreductase (nitroreductase family)
MIDHRLADEDFCYLTTTGRSSGRPREIEIWFALRGATLYMLSGGRDQSQWVRNIQRDPAVAVRLAGARFAGTARILPAGEEDRLARRLLVEKYRERDDSDLDEWGRTALPVAVDLIDDRSH